MSITEDLAHAAYEAFMGSCGLEPYLPGETWEDHDPAERTNWEAVVRKVADMTEAHLAQLAELRIGLGNDTSIPGEMTDARGRRIQISATSAGVLITVKPHSGIFGRIDLTTQEQRSQFISLVNWAIRGASDV